MDSKLPLKTALKQGGGPPPGYRWHVWKLDVADRDARGFLDEDQYAHMADQVKELARQSDPTHPATLSVDAIEGFHELREKGGLLGKINVRLFFYLDKSAQVIVILGAIKKENNGPTPTGDKIRMRHRLRMYRRRND
ncbi:MAG: hypothetical protein ABSH20_12700 [Tepidisphaeraceae bacterium]|jgi:hypothetical protein